MIMRGHDRARTHREKEIERRDGERNIENEGEKEKRDKEKRDKEKKDKEKRDKDKRDKEKRDKEKRERETVDCGIRSNRANCELWHREGETQNNPTQGLDGNQPLRAST